MENTLDEKPDELPSSSLGIRDARRDVVYATNVYETARRRLTDAKDNETKALIALDAAQYVFDNAVAAIKKDAPRYSTWGKEALLIPTPPITPPGIYRTDPPAPHMQELRVFPVDPEPYSHNQKPWVETEAVTVFYSEWVKFTPEQKDAYGRGKPIKFRPDQLPKLIAATELEGPKLSETKSFDHSPAKK